MSAPSLSACALAHAAQRLAGSPFRLHGRDPATGLDCIGVLAAALETIGKPAPLPTGYRLRCRAAPEADAIASRCGLEPAAGAVLAGDVLFARPNPVQFHLAVALDGGRFVHAHAGLGRTVITPWPAGWPIHRHYRLSPTQ